jgi:PPOX class probable F420-dependent enzyme
MIERVASLQYRFYDRMRHRDALRVAKEPGRANRLESLQGHHYCLVTTFKRSGEPVPTPVLFGLGDGKLYFRTDADVSKVKRLRNDPHVRVGPCNWRGKPLGEFVEGAARVLPPSENERAYAVLKANYTFGTRLFESLLDRMPIEIVYVEVVPAAASQPQREAA